MLNSKIENILLNKIADADIQRQKENLTKALNDNNELYLNKSYLLKNFEESKNIEIGSLVKIKDSLIKNGKKNIGKEAKVINVYNEGMFYNRGQQFRATMQNPVFEIVGETLFTNGEGKLLVQYEEIEAISYDLEIYNKKRDEIILELAKLNNEITQIENEINNIKANIEMNKFYFFELEIDNIIKFIVENSVNNIMNIDNIDIQISKDVSTIKTEKYIFKINDFLFSDLCKITVQNTDRFIVKDNAKIEIISEDKNREIFKSYSSNDDFENAAYYELDYEIYDYISYNLSDKKSVIEIYKLETIKKINVNGTEFTYTKSCFEYNNSCFEEQTYIEF